MDGTATSHDPGSHTGEPLTATLLGAPRLRWQGQPVEPAAVKERALLYYLVVRGTPATRAELAELLWGPGRLHSVRQALTSLRRLPGAHRWLASGEPVSVRAASDVTRFADAVACGRHGEALRLARGGLLEGFFVPRCHPFEEWRDVETRRLDGLLRDALKGRAGELERAGRSAAAIDLLRRVLADDPLDEAVHRAIVRSEIARGNVQAALAQYERCERVLREELGVAPMPETVRLAAWVQRGTFAPASPGAGGRMPPALLRPPTLVGRERAWLAMERAWLDGKTIVLTGPAGVGKSRLLLDFARSRGRYLLLEGRAADRSMPLSSLARGLRVVLDAFPAVRLEPWAATALAALAPDGFPGVAPGPEPRTVTARLVDAWTRLLLAVQDDVEAMPTDDVQLFDRASVEALDAADLGMERRLGRPLRRLAALRPEEAEPAVVDAIRRGVEAGATAVIELEPLGREAVEELLDSIGLPGTQGLAGRLHDFTGGNPAFLVEVLKDLSRRAPADRGATTFALPPRISALFERRLERLERAPLRLLRAVAVTHPARDVDLLAAMVELPRLRVSELLGVLERRQLLVDGRFAHELARSAVLAHAPRSVLRLLHRRAAEILLSRGGDPRRIAGHLATAGAGHEALHQRPTGTDPTQPPGSAPSAPARPPARS